MSKPRRPYQNMPTKKLKEILDDAPYYRTAIGTDYGPVAHLIQQEWDYRIELAKDKNEKNAARNYERTTAFQIDNELPPLPADEVENIPVIESKFDLKDLNLEDLIDHMESEIYTINDPLLHEAWETLLEKIEKERDLLKYAKTIVRQMTETLQ